MLDDFIVDLDNIDLDIDYTEIDKVIDNLFKELEEIDLNIDFDFDIDFNFDDIELLEI